MSAPQPPPFDGKAFCQTLARSPGVYRMIDAEGQVLYVGKAADLRARVSSYFAPPFSSPRIAIMVAKIARIEVTLTRTEGEALLLENELIKSLKPRYNVLLRDSKSYPYIYLSADSDYPRLGFHRGARTAKGRYFGPFPSTVAVRESLSLMQKLFRVRQCEDSYFRNRTRPCLQHQIGRCTAPCVGLIGVEDYQRDVRHAAMFLDGRGADVADELAREMESASAALAFERAAALRDQIASLRHVQSRQFVAAQEHDADIWACVVRDGLACVHGLFFRNGVSLGGASHFPKIPAGMDATEVLGSFVAQYYMDRQPPSLVLVGQPMADIEVLEAVLAERRGGKVELRQVQRGDRLKLTLMAARNAEQAIASELASRSTQEQRWQAMAKLLDLPGLPERVECFDISHTVGEATVASCVVFGPQGAMKSDYRRFNIAGIAPGDDYAAMHQALERRFRRAITEQTALPDLLLIDGGKGQVGQAMSVLADLGVADVTVVGVAKGPDRRAGQEQLILGREGVSRMAAADDPGLHLIQHIRDEAHRFAITGHRQRRQRVREHSSLEEIPGIGAKRRAMLLKHFGGWAGLSGAGVEELARVQGIHRALAERIYAALHG